MTLLAQHQKPQSEHPIAVRRLSVISILVSLLIACIICGLLYWLVTLIPLPPPFGKVAQVIIAAIFVLWLIFLLLPLTGTHYPVLR
jgi:membrane protein YdbS with pleckstrin-like domain